MRKIHRPGLDAIERFFGMSFADVINVLHHEQKKSINWLSIQCGISRDTFQKQAKRLGLDLRPITESNKLTPNKGKRHWAYGLRKETDPWAKMHSERMKANNPTKSRLVRSKVARGLAHKLSQKALPQELTFKKILEQNGIRFEMQKPFESFVLDFYLPDYNICLEIDSTYKWGNERKKHAEKRDMFLLGHGIITYRINKAHLDKPDRLRQFFIAAGIPYQDSRQ